MESVNTVAIALISEVYFQSDFHFGHT